METGEEMPTGKPDPVILRVKRIIDAKNISQNDFARRSKLRHGRLTHWLNGRGSISLKQAINMANALEMPLQSLIEEEDAFSSYVRRLKPDEVALLAVVDALGISIEEAVKRLRAASQDDQTIIHTATALGLSKEEAIRRLTGGMPSKPAGIVIEGDRSTGQTTVSVPPPTPAQVKARKNVEGKGKNHAG